MQRRSFLAALAAVPLLPSIGSAASQPVVEVWKDSQCGCCNEWIKHMRTNGFTVKAYDVGNSAKRQQLGIPRDFGSCHTALVDGYAIEGHAPAREVKRLLREKPNAIGLAVPGMPMGSPGMEQGGRVDPYTVLLVKRDLRTLPYANYGL